MRENINFSKGVRRMLGLSLDGWNNVMLLCLAAVAIAAISVGVAQYVIIKLAKQEASDAKKELDEYKLTVEGKVADAKSEGIKAGETASNALVRAEELRAANLALEAQIAPRRLERSQQQKIADALVVFAGRNVAVVSYAMDAESALLGQQLIEVLSAARLPPSNKIATVSSLGGFALGIHVSGPDEELASAIRKALGNFTGLAIASKEQTSPPMIGAGMSSGGGTDVPTAASILVGIKPIAR